MKKLFRWFKNLFVSAPTKKKIDNGLPKTNKKMTPYEVAKSYLGHKEVRGRENNPVIVGFFRTVVNKFFADEVPWCAAFVGATLQEAGYKSSGKLNARSYLKWGEPTDDPKEGDIVVFWRGSKYGWQGHVGYFVKRDLTSVTCLGGNQDNAVSIAKYPRYKVLGYRKLEV